jgi:hypothetical protein
VIRDVNNPTLERTNNDFFHQFPIDGAINEVQIYPKRLWAKLISQIND